VKRKSKEKQRQKTEVNWEDLSESLLGDRIKLLVLCGGPRASLIVCLCLCQYLGLCRFILDHPLFIYVHFFPFLIERWCTLNFLIILCSTVYKCAIGYCSTSQKYLVLVCKCLVRQSHLNRSLSCLCSFCVKIYHPTKYSWRAITSIGNVIWPW
jgi:hypothetical protein